MEYFSSFYSQEAGRNSSCSPFSPLSTNFGFSVVSTWNGHSSEPTCHSILESLARPKPHFETISQPRSTAPARSGQSRKKSALNSKTSTQAVPFPSTTSLYSLSNISGEFRHSLSPKCTPTKSILRQRNRSRSRTLFSRKTAVRSLVRSRMKLWNLTWLTCSLHQIPEDPSRETLELDQPAGKCWSSEPLEAYALRSSNYTETQQHVEHTTTVGHEFLPWPIDPAPPCPLSVVDEGSDSDEDLDRYDFELSSCFPTPPPAPVVNLYATVDPLQPRKVSKKIRNRSRRIKVRNLILYLNNDI